MKFQVSLSDLSAAQVALWADVRDAPSISDMVQRIVTDRAANVDNLYETSRGLAIKAEISGQKVEDVIRTILVGHNFPWAQDASDDLLLSLVGRGTFNPVLIERDLKDIGP